MMIFTATLCLIIAVVIALAGVAASSGSIHWLGGHFVLSGRQLSSLTAGKLFPSPIVARIAGLLGFSTGFAAQMAVSRNSGHCGTADHWCPASGVTADGLVDDARFTNAPICALDSVPFLGARAPLEALMTQVAEKSTSAARAGSSFPASQL